MSQLRINLPQEQSEQIYGLFQLEVEGLLRSVPAGNTEEDSRHKIQLWVRNQQKRPICILKKQYLTE